MPLMSDPGPVDRTPAEAPAADGGDAPILLPRRVLIIRPSALGDVCRSVPLAASLHAHWPQAQIDWLVQDTFAPAVSAHPAVHAVVPFARSRLGKLYQPAVMREAASFVLGLSRPRYDVVIDAQGLLRSGLFAFATRARIRVGFANAQELGWLGCNVRVPAPRGVHAVDRMLALLGPLGVPAVHDLRLYTAEADRAAIASDERLQGRLAVLAPTSRWPGKRWDAARFARLAGLLLDSGKADRVAVVGGKSERPQCAPLLDMAAVDPRVVDLVGGTSVGGLMAVVERAALVVANDSAALHMAVGFNRPMVALFGPTDVARVGPYGQSRWVIQHVSPGESLDHKDKSLGRSYMDRINVDEVAARALEALGA